MARDDGKSAARGARKGARKTGGARKAGARKTGGRKSAATARKTGARKATARKTARKGGRKAAAGGARKTTRKTTRQTARQTTSQTTRKTTGARKSTGGRKTAGARKTAAGRGSVLWIETPEQHAERPGQTLATRNHDVIRAWAEERNGAPATVEGTGPGNRLGVLRFDFPFGGKSAGLRQVDWDEWFETFDDRNLVFLFQEQLRSGRQSNFFRLDNPEREDG